MFDGVENEDNILDNIQDIEYDDKNSLTVSEEEKEDVEDIEISDKGGNNSNDDDHPDGTEYQIIIQVKLIIQKIIVIQSVVKKNLIKNERL